MLDEEVEILLREIREGVKTRPKSSAITHPFADNGDLDPLMIIKNSEETLSNASRLDSYLTTTGRAWDRLPPIVSKRAGAAGRLEIWLKSRLKTLTRWFTWEQVNFNAAVHHALRDVIREITEERRVLEQLIQKESQARQTGMEQLRAELETSRTVIDSELRAQQNESERQSVEINALRAAIQEQKSEQARLVDLISELRKIQTEHRVCCRQFDLEQSETVALRRRSELKVQAVLEELGKRIEALEQGTKRS